MEPRKYLIKFDTEDEFCWVEDERDSITISTGCDMEAAPFNLNREQVSKLSKALTSWLSTSRWVRGFGWQKKVDGEWVEDKSMNDRDCAHRWQRRRDGRRCSLCGVIQHVSGEGEDSS